MASIHADGPGGPAGGGEAVDLGLVAAMNEGFAVHEILLGPDGRPEDYRFLQVNAAFERQTGLPAAAVIGRRAREVIPALDRSLVERYGEVALRGTPITFEQTVAALGRTFRVSAYRPAPGRFACVFTDVTEQRRAEAERLEAVQRAERSEARLRTLAEQSRDVIWTLDLATGRFTYVSPSIQSLRGLTPEEALAEPLEASLTPESLARAAAVIAKIGTPEEEDPHTGVYDQPCRDGSIKHVEITTTYQRDAQGRPITALGISRDATDRVRAERALRHSEALYRSLFEASPSGVILGSLDGRLLAFNDSAASRLGYTREEFSRLAIWDIDAEDDQATVLWRIERIMKDGQYEFDAIHKARDGSRREVHVKAVRVDLPDGLALLSTWDDLTEPRRLERELRLRLAERDEGERWLQASQRVALLGHYVFDVAADRWTSSQMLDEILGIGPDHPRTREGWIALVHPDERAAMEDYLEALAASGSRFDRIYRVGRAGDPPRWVHGLGDLSRDAEGRPLRLVGTIQDITARRLAEQAQEALAGQLREAQKLESIGRLAGGVAHDFNNILVVLLGCADSLAQSQAEGRPPAPEDVAELQEAARRAKALTSQLLAFARRKVVAPVVLDLDAEVRRAERMLQRLLGEDVQLSLQLQPGLWPVTFDPDQLQQVLLNLAANSRDAMPRGGRLTISTANVEVPATPEAGWQGTPVESGRQVRLRVEDSGQGIPPELWPRVFEPFVTSKPVGHGTGLGLATVYGIVRQAGGAIRFRSEAGQGTVFEILLTPSQAPVAVTPVPGPAAAVRPAERPSPTGERILVVEDDPQVRAAACRALRQAGYQVTEAAGGAQVRDLLAGGLAPPHLLLTDVVMPGMNGRQVAELARTAWPDVRVLFMSGYAQDIIVHHGVVDAGLNLLEKPFTSEALVARVRAALGR